MKRSSAEVVFAEALPRSCHGKVGSFVLAVRVDAGHDTEQEI